MHHLISLLNAKFLGLDTAASAVEGIWQESTVAQLNNNEAIVEVEMAL